MAVYTVDTHSLVWHFTQSPKLGEKAKNCFASIESGFATAYVPIIVMAEAFYISRRKRIDFDFEKLLDKILVSPNYFLYPFDYEVFVQIINLGKLSGLIHKFSDIKKILYGMIKICLLEKPYFCF